MPRYIDADFIKTGLKQEFCTACSGDYENKRQCCVACDIAYAIILMDVTPTADVEPVRHGRWIECDYKRLEHGMIETYPKAGYCCSVCRTAFEKKKMTYKQHCPHCGAKMDGGDE